MIEQLQAWVTALIFATAMITSWIVGRSWARRPSAPSSTEPETKFTDASMALLGLLLAFTFSMSLGRHDDRRKAAVADSNSIGDFYTCATLLKEPSRSKLQTVLREYARHKLDMARGSLAERDLERATQRSFDLHDQATALVAEAIAQGTPIAAPLTNTLNNVTSCNAAYLAAYQERLPWIIVVLLLAGSVIPAFLMGLQQGTSRATHLSGTFGFMVLVTLVIYVTFDLNQPTSGLIRVSQKSLERLVQSMAK